MLMLWGLQAGQQAVWQFADVISRQAWQAVPVCWCPLQAGLAGSASVQMWFAGRPGRLLLYQCAYVIRRQAWQAAADLVQPPLPELCMPPALGTLAWEQPQIGFSRGRFSHQKLVSALAQPCCHKNAEVSLIRSMSVLLGTALLSQALHRSVVNALCALQAD